MILRTTGLIRRWAGIGYLTNADRDFISSYYKISHDRFIRVISQELTRFPPAQLVTDGPIVSLGVSKRDYGTLIDSLTELPGYITEIYAGSRFDDFHTEKTRKVLPEWIRFCDPVPSYEIPDLYRRARFVVLPLINTTQFSAGMTTALEASAAGKAVIATSLPGMFSYIRDGVTGILVPPHDRVAMRDAIHRLWTQPELAHQMGLAGRQYIEKEFNPVVVNNHIREFLMKVYAESQHQA
jgi:glycosyltransferase involved in cell wall biosynthesis